MKLTFALAAGLMLGGCVPMVGIGAGAGAGGFASGWFANPGNDIALLNAAMQVDAPIKYRWCAEHPTLPAVVAVYCANVPTSVNDLPRIINLMIEAEMVK